jgi:hypothetical protein
VGIYAACRELPSPHGQEYWFYEASLAERNDSFHDPSILAKSLRFVGSASIGLLACPLGQGPLQAASAFFPDRVEQKLAKRFLHARRFRITPAQTMDLDARRAVGQGYYEAKPGAWRKLRLEVTPTQLCAFWGEDLVPFASVPHPSNMRRDLRALTQTPPLMNQPPFVMPPASFGSQGGLGLFVKGGSNGGKAMFRNAVLEPLRED